MSKYEKPMVMVNEELAEGVYAAASGSNEKWQYKNSNTFGGADVPNGSVGLDIRVHNTYDKDNSQWENYEVRIPLTGEPGSVVVTGGNPNNSASYDGNYLVITGSAIANPHETTDIKVVITPKNPGESIGIVE